MKEVAKNRQSRMNTVLGLIPDEWNSVPICDVLKIGSGKDYKHLDDGDIPVYGTGGLMTFVNDFLFEGESIGIGRKGTIDKPVFLTGKFWTVDTLFYTHSFKNSIPRFIYYLFQKIDWYRFNEASGVPSLSKTTIEKIRIPLPPLLEQQKISAILATWDIATANYKQLLSEYLRRKKGLEQQLLSGKVRFPEFINSSLSIKTPLGELPVDWILKQISEIVQRVKNPLTPETESLYREIGIRSHCKGIFHKEEVTGKSLGNKSVFWIQPDCFVVNIVFAWEHAIAKTTEAEVGMIASHRFPMYRAKEDVLDLDYLLYYFKTARGKHLLGLASPGGAGRNKTLGQGEFAKLKIPVPSIEEQKRIVAVLSESDKEIDLLKQQIETLKEQKKGLMQKLLTGEIRVNTQSA